MALTPTEEAQTRQLIAQEAPLLSLASNEPTITSKLGATKVNLSQLPAATAPADADIYLVRQGTTDKSVAGSVLKSYVQPSAATDTTTGVVALAVAANYPSVSDVEAATPAYVNSALANVQASIQGAFKNLAISTTGTSAPVTVTADELVVENTANAYRTLRAVSITPSLANANGANGLDTGTSAISTWYAVWVIWNGTTTAGLLSLSATAPTMPSGYTHKARVGWIRTDASANKYPFAYKQTGRSVNYLVGAGTNVAALRTMASGAAGDDSVPTYVAVAVGTFVPPTASIIRVQSYTINNSTHHIIAPSSAYGKYGDVANPPPVAINWAATAGGSIQISMMLESTNIYWANNGSGSQLYCAGWEDNL